MAAGAAQHTEHILCGEGGLGLQPQGDDTGHHGGGHGGAAVGVPGVGAAVEGEMGHVRLDIVGLGIVLEVVAAVGGDDIGAGGHHIGLDTAVEGGTYRRIGTHPAVVALVVGHIVAQVVAETGAVAGGAHTDYRGGAAGRVDRMAVVGDAAGEGRYIACAAVAVDFGIQPFHLCHHPLLDAQLSLGLDIHLEHGLRAVVAGGIGLCGDVVGYAVHEEGVGEEGVGTGIDGLGREGIAGIGVVGMVELQRQREGVAAPGGEAARTAAGEEADAGRLHTGGLARIVVLLPLVASRGHKDAARPHQTVDGGVEEHVVAPEVLVGTFAERHHTGHAALGGIVEDVLEAKHIGGIGVFVDIGAVDEDEVARHGIAHQADVALIGDAAVGGVVAGAGRRPQGMGAVGLDESVA